MGGGSTSKSKASVWGPQAGYLSQLYENAFGLQQQQYGQDRVAGFNATQESALQMAAQRATDPNSLTRTAQGELKKTLAGDYLSPDSNPYLAEFGKRVGESFHGEVNALGSRMEAAGRTGGGTHAQGTDRAQQNLSRGLSNLYGGAYEAERGRMTSGLGQVGDLAYRDISALQAVGQARQGQEQRELDDMTARFQQGQNAPYELLQQQAGLIGGPTVLNRQYGSGTNVGLGCHAAAEYFGWFTQDWFYARDWIIDGWKGDEADKFRSFYLRNSAELAAEIRDDPDLKEEWRGIFEAFRNLGRDA